MKKETKEIFENLFLEKPVLLACKEDILQAYKLIKKTYVDKKILLVCGNGGSASDSEHIVGELMKSFKMKRPLPKNPNLDESIRQALSEGLPAISLSTHTSLMTAIGNDSSFEMVYAQQVYGFKHLAGALMCLSTSGNAKNVNNAASLARAYSIPVIGLTGRTGGKLASLSDVCIRVEQDETYKVQELHLPIYHCLCAMIECEMFDE